MTLSQYCKSHGIKSVCELASLTGIPRPTLYRWFKDTRKRRWLVLIIKGLVLECETHGVALKYCEELLIQLDVVKQSVIELDAQIQKHESSASNR